MIWKPAVQRTRNGCRSRSKAINHSWECFSALRYDQTAQDIRLVQLTYPEQPDYIAEQRRVVIGYAAKIASIPCPLSKEWI